MKKKANLTPIVVGIALVAFVVVIYGNPPWREAAGKLIEAILFPILNAVINFFRALFSGNTEFL